MDQTYPAIVVKVPAPQWQGLVKQLFDAGMTQRHVAAAIGVSQTWVSEVGRGIYDDVAWQRGQRLLKLHREVFKSRSARKLRLITA